MFLLQLPDFIDGIFIDVADQGEFIHVRAAGVLGIPELFGNCLQRPVEPFCNDILQQNCGQEDRGRHGQRQVSLSLHGADDFTVRDTA